MVLSFFSLSSCDDRSLLTAVEDAKNFLDSSVADYFYIHSIAFDRTTAVPYLGAKTLWTKPSGKTEWEIASLPLGFNANQTPVVSIVIEGSVLFLASSDKVYRKDLAAGRTWSNSFSGSSRFTFGALWAAGGKILVQDLSGKIYEFVADGNWTERPSLRNADRRIKGFAHVGGEYYLAVGEKLKKGAALPNLSDSTATSNWGQKQISAFIGFNDGSSDFLGVLSEKKLYLKEPSDANWVSYESRVENFSMIQIADKKLLVTKKAGGYQEFNLTGKKWENGNSTSGLSIQASQLGYLQVSSPGSEVYAATRGSHGLFIFDPNENKWKFGITLKQ